MELNFETVSAKNENKDFITAPITDMMAGSKQKIDTLTVISSPKSFSSNNNGTEWKETKI